MTETKPIRKYHCTAILFAGSSVLLLLGIVFLINGLQTLTSSNFGGDLKLRWREQQLVLHGVNPYDVSAKFLHGSLTLAEVKRLKNLASNTIEPINSSGYPPWGFLTSILFIYPGDFRIAQYGFAALNVLALGFVIFWAYQVGRPYGTTAGFFLGASIFAIFGQASTLRLGQYGIICNALLIGLLLAEEKRKEIPAGLAFAMAAIKPNFSGLFFLILVVRRRIIAIAAASACIFAASLLVGFLVNTSPIEMIQQMIRQSSAVSAGGVGPLNILIDLQVPYRTATTGLGIAGLIASLVLMMCWRNSSTLTLFAIAAIIGRLTVYHRQYDNVMLVFPLVALGLYMFEKPNLWRICIFVVFGSSLWIPLRYIDYTHAVQFALAAVWLAGLCAILVFSSSKQGDNWPAPGFVL